MICVNNELKVDVFRRGNQQKLKSLDIEYMRCSLVHEKFVFIGTEEKMIYMVSVPSFTIVDQLET
jgi:hypothetical protein